MDLRQLRYFVVIAESASLSEAARKLHIVQPALSKRLSDLEHDLGSQLIVRGRHGTALTEAGAELYKRAQVIEKQLDAARHAVRERDGAVGGPVAIGVLRTLAPAIAGRLFLALKERLPSVMPDIRVGYSAELFHMLRAGRLDITMHLPQEGVPTGNQVYAERLCLVGTTALLAGRKPVLQPSELSDVPLLLSSLQPIHSLLLDLASRERISLQVIGGIEDGTSVLDVCESGSAATVMSEWAARKAQSQRGLAVIVVEHPELVRRVQLAVNEEIPRTQTLTLVEEVMARILEDLMDSAADRGTYRVA